MAAEKPATELREELAEVEGDLASLRRSAASLRQSIGEGEPGDAADRAATLTAAEEQEALIERMEARRADLLRRLGPG